jgi:hypothetical protein
LQDVARDVAAAVPKDPVVAPFERRRTTPPPATVFGRAARRYQHLAVIDGGREN